jgi:hypothetical protein
MAKYFPLLPFYGLHFGLTISHYFSCEYVLSILFVYLPLLPLAFIPPFLKLLALQTQTA